MPRSIWLDNGHMRADGPTNVVVDHYLEQHVATATAGSWIDMNDARRIGTGEVRFERIRYDGPGDPQGMPRPGGRMRVELVVKAHRKVKIGSLAVKADAWHHRSDAITSAAAFIGIAVALLGGERWVAADDWAALLASVLIAWNGYRLLAPALEDLMDRAPDDDVIVAVRSSAGAVDDVRRVEKALVRRAGMGYFITLHIEADGDMPLRDAHLLGHLVKDRVMAEVPSALDVIVHMEPFDRPRSSPTG
jgi:cation diffusion facilitator family transporter